MADTPSHLSEIKTIDGRGRILDAAMGLFAARGFDGVSISDVAQSAGLVKSAIYHHFPSKEALYLAVLKQTVQQSRDLMEEAAKGNNWKERLRGAALAVGRLVGPRSHVLSLILEGMAQSRPQGDPSHSSEIAGLRREFVSVIAREIDYGMGTGELKRADPILSSLCLIGLIAAVQQATMHASIEEAVTFAFDFFLNGAGSSPSRDPRAVGES